MPVASNSMMPPIFPTIPLTMPLPMSQINPTVTPSLSQRQTFTTDHTRDQSQPILANTAIDENRSAITSNLNSISLPTNEKFQETDATAKGLIQSDDTPLESYQERGGRRYCLLAKYYIKDSTCRTPNAQPKAWNYLQMKSEIFECNGNYNAMQKCSTKENLVAVGSGQVVGTFRCGGKQEMCDVIYKTIRYGDYFAYYKSTGSHSPHLRPPGAISRDLNRLILKNLDINYATSNIINTLRNMEIGQLESLLGNRTESFLHTEAGKETLRKQIKNVIGHAKNRRKKTKMLQLKNSTGRPSVRSFHDVLQIIKKDFVNLDELISNGEIRDYDRLNELFPGDNNQEFACYYTSHDFGENESGTYTHIQWISKQTIRNALAAVKLSLQRREPILLQADYTHSKLENDDGVLGITGISDMWRQFHAMTMDYNVSENSKGSENMMLTTKKMLILCGYTKDICGPIYIIIDGSDKLRKASINVGFIPRRCAVHIYRKPDKTKGKKGYSGTAGSLYRYLLKHNVPEHQVLVIRLVLYSMYYLAECRLYKKGRAMLLHDFENGEFYGLDRNTRKEIQKHLFEFYIPPNPEYGFAGTLPGQVKSTNG